MHLSRTAKMWLGIVLGVVLLYAAALFAFRTTGRETEGPAGTISAMGFVPARALDPEDYRVTSYRVVDSGTRVVSTQSPTAAYRNRSFSIIGTSPLGNAWKFTANVSWSYSTGTNPRILSVNWGQSGVTYLPGWSYRGVSGDIRTGGVNQSYAYRRVTGQFEFCLPICYFSDYPWIAFTVRNNGTSTLSWGG